MDPGSVFLEKRELRRFNRSEIETWFLPRKGRQLKQFIFKVKCI